MQKAKKRKSKIGTVAYWTFIVLWVALLALASTYIWKDARSFGEYWEAAQIDPKLNAYLHPLRLCCFFLYILMFFSYFTSPILFYCANCVLFFFCTVLPYVALLSYVFRSSLKLRRRLASLCTSWNDVQRLATLVRKTLDWKCNFARERLEKPCRQGTHRHPLGHGMPMCKAF